MISDPIEFALFKNSLFSIADEMALTNFRTTYSCVLKDGLDGNSNICANMAAQSIEMTETAPPMEENSSMRRAILAVAAMLAFGSVLLPAMPALAGYGAIAWDQETGKRGSSWNQSTSKRAEEMALSECGASGCKIVTRIGPAMCGALATTEDGKQAGAAWRKTRDAARLAALANCPKKAGECIVRVTDCNK